MPILRDSEDIYNNDENEALSLELDLLQLEIHQSQTNFEGWIMYRLTLCEGEKTLVQRDGSIHEDDVNVLESFLGDLNASSMDFEPMEPDFVLSVKHFMEEDWTLTCMVNYGKVRHAYYGRSAIGVRLLITEADAQKFAEDLREQHSSLMETTEKN